MFETPGVNKTLRILICCMSCRKRTTEVAGQRILMFITVRNGINNAIQPEVDKVDARNECIDRSDGGIVWHLMAWHATHGTNVSSELPTTSSSTSVKIMGAAGAESNCSHIISELTANDSEEGEFVKKFKSVVSWYSHRNNQIHHQPSKRRKVISSYQLSCYSTSQILRNRLLHRHVGPVILHCLAHLCALNVRIQDVGRTDMLSRI